MLWFQQGLRQNIKTLTPENESSLSPGLSAGWPAPTAMRQDTTSSIADVCPTHALKEQEDMVKIDYGRCIQCRLCHQRSPGMNWERTHHGTRRKSPGFSPPFRHSLHVKVLDAGDCGACLNEIRQLASPVYSLHRLGISVTPTPREADVLLVTGPVTVSMRTALEKAFQAMPEPKRIMAVGTCAISGGIFSPSFALAGPLERVIPVDIEVPGCPPPPLALLEGFRQLMGYGPKNRQRKLTKVKKED